MNIFYLDENPQQCARYHCDKHVVKMITETAQLLSSAFYFTGEDKAPYRLTHANHPCAKWARLSKSNWLWLADLGICLYREYKYRYNFRVHKAGEAIMYMQVPNLFDAGFWPPPKCMPEEYKVEDAVQSYRNYYLGSKQHILSYTRREVPSWLKESLEGRTKDLRGK